MGKFADPKTYAKNLLKSAKYVSVETIKGINPDFTDYVSESSSTVKDMYRTARSYKTDFRGKVTNLIGEDGVEALKSVKGNVISDLKSGKFYNQERSGESMEKVAKSMGFDFDFDFDDFENSFNEDDSSEEPSEERRTTNAVLTIGEEISASQKKAAEYTSLRISKSNNINTKAMMAHNEQMFGLVNNSIMMVNSSILSFHNDIAKPLSDHITNSTSFFETATTELGKQTKMLENISKLLSDRFAPTTKFGSNKEKSAWEKVTGYGGLPSISEYIDIVKNRAKNNSGLGLLGAFSDSLGPVIGTAAASPISFALTTILKSKAEKGPTSKALDKTLDIIKGGFANVSSKIHYTAKHNTGVLGTIAQLLDIAPSDKARLNFGNYNKGRQDWTGMDSKALRDVIPTQLASILSVLTGKPAKIFDYKTGKFVSAKSIISSFKSERKSVIGSSTSELRNSILDDFIKEDAERHANDNVPIYRNNSRAVRNLSKDYDSLMTLLTINNVNTSQFQTRNSIFNYCKNKGWFSSGMLNEKSIDTIDRLIFKSNTSRGKLVSASYQSRIANNSFMDRSSNESIALLANGSGISTKGTSSLGNRLLNDVDKYGNSVFNYLQDYYKQLRMIANNTSGIGRRGSGYSGGNINTSGYQMQDITLRERTSHNTGSSLSNAGSTDSAAASDPEGRYEYNSITGEYNPSERTESATSRFTREREEKTSPLSRAVDKMNGYLDKIFFGNGGEAIRNFYNEHNGILGIIKDFPSILKDAIPKGIEKAKELAQRKWNEFRESEWGQDFFGATKNMVKGYFKDTINHGKARAADVYRFFNNGNAAPWEASLTGAYQGGMVSKSGMASVSEGEMIIPAKYNPYYNGHMTDGARKSIETKNYKDWLKAGGNKDEFFGFFRKGSRNVKKPVWTELSSKEKEIIEKMYDEGKSAQQIASKIKKPIKQVKKYFNSLDRKGAIDVSKQEIVDKVEEIKNSEKVSKISSLINEASDRINSGLDSLFGKSDKYKSFKETTNEISKVIKKDSPKTAAAGALGALVGAAATGSGLGLIGGLGIGAGIHILKNSESLSNKLFGEYDEADDKWKGGKLPDKVTKFIKNKMPKMAKSGTIGAVLGTLGVAPGGIFGGFALGAGLELVSTTDTFKNIMFGHEDVNGQRNGGIVGSLKVRIVDPLANFVKDGISHIGDFVKKNFYEPIKGMFNPLKDWFKGKAIKMATGVGIGIKNKFDKAMDKVAQRFDFLLNPITKVGKFVGKKAIDLGKGIISAPGKALTNMAIDLNAHNIARGYSSKTAKERLAMEGQHYGLGALKTVKNSDYTKWAANASHEDIVKAEHFINGASSFKRETEKKRIRLSRLVIASLANGGAGNTKVVSQINKIFKSKEVQQNNDFTRLIYLIQNLDESVIGSATKQKVIEKIKEYQRSIQSDIDNNANFKENQQKFFNEIKKNNPNININKFMKSARVQSRLDANNARMGLEAEDNEFINKGIMEDNAAKKLKEQEQADPMGAKNMRMISGIKNLIGGIAVKLGVESKDVPKFKEDDNKIISEIKSKMMTASMKYKAKKFEKGKEAEEGQRKTEFSNGEAIEYVYTNGEWVADKADASTNNALARIEEDREIKNDFYKGGFIDKLKGLFDGTSENENKKESIFDKFKGLLGGLLGAKGLGGSIKGIVPSLIKLLPAALGTALTAIGLGKLGEKYAGTGKDSGMYAGADAEARKEEVANMNIIGKAALGANGIENTFRNRDTTTYAKDDFTSEYLSTSFGKGLAKNAALSLNSKYARNATKLISKVGKIPLVGTALKASLVPGKALNKAVNSEAMQKASSKLGKAMSSLDNKIFSKVADTKAGENMMKASDAIHRAKERVVKVLEGIVEKFGLKKSEEVIADTAEEISGQMAKKGGSKFVKCLAKASGILYVAIVANAIIEGMQDAKAKTILGILDRPTLAQRALAACCNGINEAIPGIGGIIPTDILFSIVFTALKALGLPVGRLAEQRAEAKAVVEAYNKENGTTYNVEEYIHNVLKEYTVQEKIGKAVKSVASPFKKFFKNDKSEEDTEPEDYDTSEVDSNYRLLNEKGTVRDSYEGNNSERGNGFAFRDGFGGNSKIFNKLDDSIESSKKQKGFVSKAIASGSGLYIGGASLNHKGSKTSNNGYSTMSNLMSYQSSTIPNVDNLVKDLWKFSDPKKSKMTDFDSVVSKYKKGTSNSLGNTVIDTISGTMKMYDSIIRSMNTLNSKISEANKNLKTTSSESSTVNKSSSAWSWIKGKAQSVVNFLTGNNDSSSSDSSSSSDDFEITHIDEESGGSSNIHTRQTGNFRRFGKSTIDQNGCGPAVASTVLKSYGKNVGINDAASYAEKNGYVAGKSGIKKNARKFQRVTGGKSEVGTRASYFNDILGSQGIDTEYESNKRNIKSAIRAGKPTILLGQDKSNTSKQNSPFGPNPHYVVARGTDRKGNIIVDDPELKGTTTYNRNILNKTNLGIVTGGASGVSGLMSDITGSVFGKTYDTLGTKAGTILKWIVSDGSTDEETADATGSDGGMAGGNGANFTPLGPEGKTDADIDAAVPEKYRVLYNNSSNRGLSQCIHGNTSTVKSPEIMKRYNVLPNCVGWAWGRFNQIASEITGTVSFKYFYRGNGGDIYANGKANGYKVSQTPSPGAMGSWSYSGGGHVAVVESIDANGDIIISESGWSGGFCFKTTKLTKASGYKLYNKYKPNGFVIHPLVQTTSTGSSGSKDYTPTIWKFLIQKGFTEYAAAGVMGCWQEESGNNPFRLEADFLLPSSQKESIINSTLNGGDKAMNDYCLKYVFPNTSSAKKSGYLLNGYYYPGFGLAQWTGVRTINAVKFLKEHNYSFGSIEGQLNFAWYEFSHAYKSAFNKLNAAKSVDDATSIALIYYEGCSRSSGKYAEYYAARRKDAQSIYNRFKGTVSSVVATGSGIKNKNLLDRPRVNKSTKTSNSKSPFHSKYASSSGLKSFRRINKLIGGASNTDNVSSNTGITSPSDTAKSFSSTSSSNSAFFKSFSDGIVNDIGKSLSEKLFKSGSTSNNTTSISNSSTSTGTSEFNSSWSSNKQPVVYYQTDSRWKYNDYSAKGEKTTIGASGCGPTSMAMVLATLCDKSVTPATECAWALANGYKCAHSGTYYNYFVPAGRRYGLNVTQLNAANIYGNDSSSYHEQARNAINNGNLVIACMGKGNWTKSGHYILVWKISGNTIYINDPASTKLSRTQGDYSLFKKQVKYYWVIEVPSSYKKGLTTNNPDKTGSSSGINATDFSTVKKINSQDNSTTTYKSTINRAVNKTTNRAKSKRINSAINKVSSTAAKQKSEDSSAKLDKMLVYLDQIVSNTSFNSNIPNIVEIVTQLLDVISGMNKNMSTPGLNKPSSNDTVQNTDREIQLMKAKLEAIARTL